MMARFLIAIPMTVIGVPTPHGDRAAECVVEIPDGATFFEAEDGLVIEHSNGTLQTVFVHPKCHEDDVALELARRRSGDEPNVWKDNAGYTYKGQGGYKKFTGKYTIPSNPRSGGQTLYYFIGMQNNHDGPLNILQPVLGWFGDHWGMNSWSCCPKNITTHSKLLTGLQAGQTVYGAMERIGVDTWKVDSTVGGKTTTLTPRVGIMHYDWADVTLEVYNVNQCSQYSDGTTHFTEMELTAANGQVLTPQWTQPSGSDCQGKLVIHDARTIDISHNGGGTSCTPSYSDPWESGAHVPCCSGTTETLDNWDGDGRYYYKCIPGTGCTPAQSDPWASGSHVPCCSGTTEVLKNWDGDGRYYYRCMPGMELV